MTEALCPESVLDSLFIGKTASRTAEVWRDPTGSEIFKPSQIAFAPTTIPPCATLDRSYTLVLNIMVAIIPGAGLHLLCLETFCPETDPYYVSKHHAFSEKTLLSPSLKFDTSYRALQIFLNLQRVCQIQHPTKPAAPMIYTLP